MKTRIAVYLSSKTDLDPRYEHAVRAVGQWLGQTGRTLVYGGARKGLMEVLAATTKQAGGRVVGVVPQVLVDRDLVSENIDVTVFTADLHDRKAAMMRESELILALPGGVGTLDEIFTALALRTIGSPSLPVVLFNVGGCWDALLETLRQMADSGLVSESVDELVAVVGSVEELEAICK